jgi:hypothetical protein
MCRGIKMRDDQYCETMLEAYRDILSKLIDGRGMVELNDYLLEQISFYAKWMNEELNK